VPAVPVPGSEPGGFHKRYAIESFLNLALFRLLTEKEKTNTETHMVAMPTSQTHLSLCGLTAAAKTLVISS